MREPFDIQRLRRDFPQLERQMHDRPLVFLDSAATSLKPRSVIDALARFYAHDYATVRRGIYQLSQEATSSYEGVREKARVFFGARSASEIVFVRGVTEGVNLVANSLGRSILQPGDEVLVTHMEHHANIVPWQLVCKATGATLKVAPINDAGELLLDEMSALVGPRTKIVSVVHVSNALGTVNPVKEVVAMGRRVGAAVLVDGAQSAAHMRVDVQDLDCDFFVCSGHKMLGPTGAGLLYGKAERFAAMPPWQGGGEMIDKVSFEETTFDEPPHRFEAGTPPIASVIGLGAALDYLEAVGRENIAAWEHELLTYATARIQEVPGVRLVGTARRKAGILSFVMEGAHPFDLGTLLDEQGVAIRVGHHCAQPVMRRFGVPATARASFGPYNTAQDVDAFIAALDKARRILS